MQLLRDFVLFDRRLEHFKYSRFVINAQTAARSRLLMKFRKRFQARFRFDVARRKDADDDRGLRKFNQQCLVEVIVAVELEVPPDSGLLAEKLRKSDVQPLVQQINPSLIRVVEVLVIEVRIADEEIMLEHQT